MTDPKWIIAQAPKFLDMVIDEKLTTIQIHEWMEEHFQRPFSEDDAWAMHNAMYDAVGDVP